MPSADCIDTSALPSSVEFREMPDFPGYRFGADGSVWSAWYRGGNRRRRLGPWRCLTQFHRGPYYFLRLNQGQGRKQQYVHVLIATAFHGPRPPGKQVAHGNGDPHDNRAINLRWATARENALDCVSHGRGLCGERHWKHKLTKGQAQEIMDRRAAGERVVDLAREFHLDRHSVTNICRGRTWRYALGRPEEASALDAP